MKKYKIRIKRAIGLAISTIILSTTSFATEQYAPILDLEHIEYMAEYIKSNYIYDIDNDKLTQGALKGLFYHLDPYSNYYTPDEYKKLTEQLSGESNTTGIGIRMSLQQGKIIVTDVIKGYPADKAGLKNEDTIISIDGQGLENMSLEEVASLVRGEEDTEINLEVKRAGQEEISKFKLKRMKIVYSSVHYNILENGTGYISIEEFDENSYSEVSKALQELKSKNIKNVIFDLRNNPGGYLTQVIDILKLILPKGPVVHITNPNGTYTTYNSTNKTQNFKLAVLVNENSASASEIFAGAVKDRDAGKVLGQQTYGKGLVQNIVPFTDGSAVKITVAEYLTPNYGKVNGVGIIPHIIVGNDLILKKASESFK